MNFNNLKKDWDSLQLVRNFVNKTKVNSKNVDIENKIDENDNDNIINNDENENENLKSI